MGAINPCKPSPLAPKIVIAAALALHAKYLNDDWLLAVAIMFLLFRWTDI